MPGKAAKITITERQRDILEAFVRRPTCVQRLVDRSRMVLLAFEGKNNEEIAQRLGCERHPVGRWRRRWKAAFSKLVAVECNDGPKALEKAIEQVLSDAPRSGGQKKFTAEQVTEIVKVACELPDDSGRPVTHWTPRELAEEVVHRRIVDSISTRHIGRFLKYCATKTTSDSLLVESETRRS